MRYTLHDTTAYGIYNGLDRPELEKMIRELAEEVGLGILDYSTDKIKRELDRDPEIKAEAERTYKPYPVNDAWGEAYKARYLEAISDSTAPGDGEVSNDLVADKALQILMEIHRTVIVPRLEKQREEDLRRAEILSKVVRIDTKIREIHDEGGAIEEYIHSVLMPSGRTYVFLDRNVFDFGRVINYQGGMFVAHDHKVFFSTLSDQGGWIETEVQEDDEVYMAYQAARLFGHNQSRIRM